MNCLACAAARMCKTARFVDSSCQNQAGMFRRSGIAQPNPWSCVFVITNQINLTVKSDHSEQPSSYWARQFSAFAIICSLGTNEWQRETRCKSHNTPQGSELLQEWSNNCSLFIGSADWTMSRAVTNDCSRLNAIHSPYIFQLNSMGNIN